MRSVFISSLGAAAVSVLLAPLTFAQGLHSTQTLVVSAAAARPAAEPALPSFAAPATQAAAQPRAATARPKIGFRAYGIYDGENMTAIKSFEAVLGSGTTTNVGFGVEATNLWKGVFARVAYTTSSNTGTRVFVDSSQTVHSLNIPLTIEISPIELGGGWRFRAGHPNARVAPYAGAALLLQRYTETSSFASADEDTDTTDRGQAVFGGVEISIKFLKIGVEGQYRNVSSTIGAGGASQAFNETNLGGRVFRLSFGVGF